jgi:hypothetical protein
MEVDYMFDSSSASGSEQSLFDSSSSDSDDGNDEAKQIKENRRRAKRLRKTQFEAANELVKQALINPNEITYLPNGEMVILSAKEKLSEADLDVTSGQQNWLFDRKANEEIPVYFGVRHPNDPRNKQTSNNTDFGIKLEASDVLTERDCSLKRKNKQNRYYNLSSYQNIQGEIGSSDNHFRKRSKTNALGNEFSRSNFLPLPITDVKSSNKVQNQPQSQRPNLFNYSIVIDKPNELLQQDKTDSNFKSSMDLMITDFQNSFSSSSSPTFVKNIETFLDFLSVQDFIALYSEYKSHNSIITNQYAAAGKDKPKLTKSMVEKQIVLNYLISRAQNRVRNSWSYFHGIFTKQYFGIGSNRAYSNNSLYNPRFNLTLSSSHLAVLLEKKRSIIEQEVVRLYNTDSPHSPLASKRLHLVFSHYLHLVYQLHNIYPEFREIYRNLLFPVSLKKKLTALTTIAGRPSESDSFASKVLSKEFLFSLQKQLLFHHFYEFSYFPLTNIKHVTTRLFQYFHEDYENYQNYFTRIEFERNLFGQIAPICNNNNDNNSAAWHGSMPISRGKRIQQSLKEMEVEHLYAALLMEYYGYDHKEKVIATIQVRHTEPIRISLLIS